MNFSVCKSIFALPALIAVILFGGCKPRHIPKHEIISFKPYFGIKYTEIQRRLNNGLAFNEYGYQLEPEWQLEFLANDSAQIFSPTKKTFINFPLSRGYDSIFNTARAWFKMRKMNKDSMVLEILRFSGDSIELKGNKVFMTFYANNFIKDVLHSDTGTLRRPTRKDTAYVEKLIAKSKLDVKNAFAATHPVQLIGTSSKVTIDRKVTEAEMTNNFDTSDDYLFPEFYAVVHHANDTFNYSFSIYVDEQGNMSFGRILTYMGLAGDGYKQDFAKKCQALIDGYLKYYLRVTPGSTLGMRHVSEIGINVKGYPDK